MLITAPFDSIIDALGGGIFRLGITLPHWTEFSDVGGDMGGLGIVSKQVLHGLGPGRDSTFLGRNHLDSSFIKILRKASEEVRQGNESLSFRHPLDFCFPHESYQKVEHPDRVFARELVFFERDLYPLPVIPYLACGSKLAAL